jgi:hypothetical protein
VLSEKGYRIMAHQGRSESRLRSRFPQPRRHRRPSAKVIVAILAAALVGGIADAAFGAQSVPGWLWFTGAGQTYIGSPTSGGYPRNSMVMQVGGDLDVLANHIRFGSNDGDYEFEHSKTSTTTLLNSYYSGTPTRTPIQIGGNDGQDVLSLLVMGKTGQKNDLQEWAPGGNVTAAINGNGDLRLGNVVLLTTIVNGDVELVAQLPDGSTQILAQGAPTT